MTPPSGPAPSGRFAEFDRSVAPHIHVPPRHDERRAEAMQRTERLVVHIEEAVQLGLMPDESHVRVGLMLLDSAAELMKYRECDWLLMYAAMYDGMLQSARAMHKATGDGAGWIAELEEKALTAAQRKKIEWDFNAKVDFLRQRELLPDAQARVFKKLHNYRNEVYDRDTVRPATLACAVKIYIYSST